MRLTAAKGWRATGSGYGRATAARGARVGRRGSAGEVRRRPGRVVGAPVRHADADSRVAAAHEEAPVSRAVLPAQEHAPRRLVAPGVRRHGDRLAAGPPRDIPVVV